MRKKEEECEQAKSFRREGLSIREIAKKLNVSTGSVSPWVRAIQLTPEQRKVLTKRSAAHLPKRQPGTWSNKRRSMGEQSWKEHQKGNRRRIYLKMKSKNARKFIFYRENRKRVLIQYMGGKCTKCGYNQDCPPAYDFHHPNPLQKDFSVCNKNYSIEKMKKEVQKCKLLCKRCHAEEHYALFLEQKENTISKYQDIHITQIESYLQNKNMLA